MKPRTKKILNFALIFGTLAVVLLIGVNGQEIGDAVTALKSVAPKWLIYCALAYTGFIGSDALSIHYYLRGQGYPISLAYSVYVSICGAYYSNITPGATGGQPMQVYYLTKRDVPLVEFKRALNITPAISKIGGKTFGREPAFYPLPCESALHAAIILKKRLLGHRRHRTPPIDMIEAR